MDKYLSVIVPIYNAEKYLKLCIESILNQTYRNLQIILVDDGSRDSSLGICQSYAKCDARITVIQKENGGVVSARKEGVRAAEGEVIGYVDADDWIEPDYFEYLMRLYQEAEVDIVAAAHFHDIGKSFLKVNNQIREGIHKTRDILDQMLYSGDFYEYGITPQLYTKIIRADILKATQEKVDGRIRCGEDAAVTYPSILMAQKIYVTDFCGYHYVQHQGSMTKTENKDEIFLIQLLVTFLEDCIRREAPDISSRDKLLNQLRVYNNYMLSLREISIFDKKVLLPFGGIPYGSKVLIYGAGVLGQQIYHYLQSTKKVEVVGWVDQNFNYYRQKGFCIDNPELIMLQEYDYILVANISYKIFVQIKKYLIEELMVDEQKVCWFSDDFIK